MILKNSTYDILAWTGRIVLPAMAVLVSTMGQIWNIPGTDQISASIMAVDVFLNALLGISANNYYKNKNDEENLEG